MTQQTGIKSGAQVWEGTWESISSHAAELSGLRLRVVVLDQDTEVHLAPNGERASVRGKYIGLLRSEDIIRAKQDDITLEDRRRQCSTLVHRTICSSI